METMKIERRRAATLPAYRPKRRTLDRARIRAVVKYVVLTAAGILLFKAGQASALIDRGYEALGGEVFALLLPAFYYLISRTVRDTIEDTKNEK